MRLEETTFEGHQAVALGTARAKLIVVVDCGPRIGWFGSSKKSAQNLLYWDAAKKHRRGDWLMHGGHRIWLTRAGADENEETYAPDNQPCRVRLGREGVTVEGAPDERFGTVKTLRIRAMDVARFEVRASVTNKSDMLWSGGLWAITCTLPSPRSVYSVPLGDGSDWDTVQMTIARKWAGHSSRLNDPQFRFSSDALIVKPDGHEAKRFIRAPQGIVSMREGSQTFSKQAQFDKHASYPQHSNVALYLGPKKFMLEMETMSPMVALGPGETLTHTELWTLT